jgi:hypothetical protein
MRAAYRLVHYVAAHYWRSMTSSLAIVGTRAWTGGVEAPLKRQCALGERYDIVKWLKVARRRSGIWRDVVGRARCARHTVRPNPCAKC